MNTLDKFRLCGKIAVVTGGCGNLGPWWTKALVDTGANVSIIDLPDLPLPKMLKDSPKIKVYNADVTNPESIESAHKTIKKDFGPIHILVNNAGIDIPPIKASKTNNNDKLLQERASKMWEVNVQGAVNCIEVFSKDMIKAGGGSIINIGSLYLERSPYKGLYTHLNFDKPWFYGSTKAALHQVTLHYATRLARYGIRVNTLSPGGVYNNQDPEFVKKYSERVPMGRMAYKEQDLAGPLIFLVSDASSYITGINLQVNGGYTAW